MLVKEGDIFITKLERDLFGAFKVIKKGKSFFEEMDGDLLMIAVLDYMAPSRPKLTDENLNDVLRCNRFSQSDRICISFFSDNPKYNKLDNYEYLGNKQVTDFEKSVEFKLGNGREGLKGGFSLSGVIEPSFGNNAFLEWRWTNEREKFEKEIEIETKQSKSSQGKEPETSKNPKKMIEDNLFWEIIGTIDWTKEDDDERMQPAVEALSKKTVSEIKRFQESLTYKLYQLDTREHAKNIGTDSYKNEDTYFSVDLFLYARCCVIANGKTFFENALNNPKNMPPDIDFEPLIYLVDDAYEKRMNKEFLYDTSYSYETYSNVEGWK